MATNQLKSMGETIEALCARARSGEMPAASELLGLFYERVFAFLRRLCGSDQEAADLTQKTFCKVWSSLGSFDGRANFNTWIHSIAHHVYVDWRRKTNRLAPQSDEWWQACATGDPTPSESAANHDAARRLFALVDQLDEEKRVVIHLHYFQELTLQETADALGIATSTVKYRLRQALDALGAGLAEPRIRV